VVVETELALLPLPEQVVGLALPFATEPAAMRFIVAAREGEALHPRCIEYFDELALEIVRGVEGARDWAPSAAAFVYVEEEPPTGVASALDAWLELAERCGGLVDDARVYDSESALREARRVRHAVPAHMNERGDARRSFGGRKVSTDWAVPYRRLGEAIVRARQLADESGVKQAVIYGHAGNGHPHQNFIAHDAGELGRIERVVEATLREVLAMGGTVAAEHGIGKLKRKWLPLQMTPLQVRGMTAMKHELDPNGILAPGNVL
jgi:FAD/FMN-containing dehydrogenase